MGRPPTRPSKLRDGFYLEIRSKGSSTGIKIRRDTQEQLDTAIAEYQRNKEVVVLGEYKNGKALNKKA